MSTYGDEAMRRAESDRWPSLPKLGDTVIVTFKTGKYIVDILDDIAAIEGTTRSEIIRRAIILYLSTILGEPTLVKLYRRIVGLDEGGSDGSGGGLGDGD